jgi:putative Mg2+ transporter-C (MgtC) family protein
MGMVFDLDMITRLVLASVLGGLIGLEREIHGRPAGFRTHLLVSLGSCLFTIASIDFYRLYGNFSGTVPVGVDAGRIAAQIVSGIGFLGAGAIIKEKASIRGLTTAACLWVAAAIGLACGTGLYPAATTVTVLAVLSLLLLKKVENRLRRDNYVSIKVWCDDLDGQMSKIEKLITDSRMEVVHVGIEKDVHQKEIYLEFEVRLTTGWLASDLIDSIVATGGVRKVGLE